jgi:hypothetical protein
MNCIVLITALRLILVAVMGNWRELSEDDGGMSVGVGRTGEHDATGPVASVVRIIGCSDPGSSGCACHRWDPCLSSLSVYVQENKNGTAKRVERARQNCRPKLP